MSDDKENDFKRFKEGFEILVQFIQVFVISGIGLYFAFNNDKISNFFRFSELSMNMIEHLSTPKGQNAVKGDIALITLNRSINESDPIQVKMISEIAKVIYEANADSNQKAIKVAIDILEERDTAYYHHILSLVQTNYKVINGSTNNRDSLSKRSAEKFLNSKQVVPNILYIQANSDSSKTVIQNFIFQFKQIGFYTPEIEVIKTLKYNNSIRYFDDEDFSQALEIQSIMFNNGLSCKLSRQVNKKVPKGQIELWVSLP